MKIDGLEWIDWLHKVRRESEEKRIRDGLSVEEWLRRAAERDDEVRASLRATESSPIARDGTQKKTHGD